MAVVKKKLISNWSRNVPLKWHIVPLRSSTRLIVNTSFINLFVDSSLFPISWNELTFAPSQSYSPSHYYITFEVVRCYTKRSFKGFPAFLFETSMTSNKFSPLRLKLCNRNFQRNLTLRVESLLLSGVEKFIDIEMLRS